MNRIWGICLLFLLFWEIPQLGETAVLKKMVFESEENKDLLTVFMDVPFLPLVRFLQPESCWVIDLIDVTVVGPISTFSSHIGPSILIKCAQIAYEPPIQRIYIYAKSSSTMKIIKFKSGFRVFLKSNSKDNYLQSTNPLRPHRQPLLIPSGDESEIYLDVKKFPVMQLLAKLSRQIGFDIKFRDAPPSIISIRTHASNTTQLLKQVADQIGMILTHENNDWWLTNKDNPLLSVPLDGVIDAKKLSGLTVAEALKKIGGNEIGLKLCSQLKEKALNHPIGNLEISMNPREWAQTLIQAH